MLDPVSIIGIATTAFNGLKAAVQAGREIEDCMTQVAQWSSAVADLDKSSELINKRKHSLFRSLLPRNGKSIQTQAMEAFAAKRTAMKQREELRQLIQYTTGLNGWHDFLDMEKQIRKQRQDAFYAEIERQEQLKEIAIGFGVVALALTTAGLFIWLAIAINGN